MIKYRETTNQIKYFLKKKRRVSFREVHRNIFLNMYFYEYYKSSFTKLSYAATSLLRRKKTNIYISILDVTYHLTLKTSYLKISLTWHVRIKTVHAALLINKLY